MHYKDIETFLEVVRTRNITKAAEQMHLSQSTISNRLKNLENELGYDLILRSKGHRMIQVTCQGEAFVPVAERWQNLYEETKLLKERALQTLRIATCESTFYEYLCGFTINFIHKHPSTKLAVQICDTAQIYDMVEKNLIDYGFAAYEAYRSEVISECINQQSTCVIQYAENPIPGLKILPSDLDPIKEINFTGGHFTTFNIWHKKWFGTQHVCALEINSPMAAIPYLKEFGYWALCSIKSAKHIMQKLSLQLYQLDDPPEDRKIYLLKRRDSSIKNMEIGRMFEHELREYIANIDEGDEW